jgi:hypothetical protein
MIKTGFRNRKKRCVDSDAVIRNHVVKNMNRDYEIYAAMSNKNINQF